MLKRSICARLLAGFAATSILILLIGLFSALRLHQFNAQLGRMLQHGVPRLILVDGILGDIDELGQSARGVLLADSEEEAHKYLAVTQEKRTRIGEELEQLGRIAGDQDADGRALREGLEAQSSGFLVGMVKFSREVTAGRIPEAKRLLLGVLEPKRLAMRAAIQEFRSTQSTALGAASAESERSYRSALFAIAGLSGAAIVLGIVLGLWITRTIVPPIRKAVAVADDVADGRLDRVVQHSGRDEAGQLIASLVRMQARVRAMVESILHSAQSVNAGATEIAAGSADIASRTDLQAAHLQATTATMQQLTEAVSKNAGNADKASRLANEASAAARRGGEVMGEVIHTMKGIAESSRRIEDILGVIDSIAFQTNILALNAAVEAARAGEQGRGFAVVAAEVRNLAQRSATAAREIKALIADSAQRVASGAQHVDGAGRQIAEIVELVNGMTRVIEDINAAGAEQSAGIGQVNDAVIQIDQSTQQNTAVVEQATNAAKRLYEDARNLVDALAAFKMDAQDADGGSAVDASGADSAFDTDAAHATNRTGTALSAGHAGAPPAAAGRRVAAPARTLAAAA